MKKIQELSVLCGIEACAVVYSPYSSNPEVWPSVPEVKSIVEKFEVMPEIDQEKKMVDHEGFLRQTITKTLDINMRKMKENKELMMKEAMFVLLNGKGNKFKLTDQDHDDLCKYIDQYLTDLHKHKNEMTNQPLLEYGESSSVATASVPAPAAIAEVGSSSFQNTTNVFNTPLPQLRNELWALGPINASNLTPGQVPFLPDVNNQQGFNQMMNPVGVRDQHPNLNLDHSQYQDQFGFPTMAPGGSYNPNQNQNQQEEWLVNQMMNQPDQVRFPTMYGNGRYYHHQS